MNSFLKDNKIKLYNFHNEFLLLCNLINKSKIHNSLIISGKDGIGKTTFSNHLINYIFTHQDSDSYNLQEFELNIKNKSYNLIANNSHPNLHTVNLNEGKNFISIDQIRSMITYANKSSFDNNYKIILINKSEHLNKNSSNALLKILEEPSSKTVFIILQNSENKNLRTIQSRCIKFELKLNFNETINTVNRILNDDIYNHINKEFLSFYSTPGFIIGLYNFSLNHSIDLKQINLNNFIKTIISKKLYEKNDFMNKNFHKFLEQYIRSLIFNNADKRKLFNYYDELIKKFNDAVIYNLDKESLYLDYSKKLLNE
tara:strand:- start:1073 stop:2014 length:942 start_codon:yes stop_codon:yes gene_type:complete